MTPTLHRTALAALFILLLFAPSLGAYPVLLMKLMCFALFASAFNLLLGYSGLFSLGHAAFFGASAYAAGLSAKHLGLSPELCLLVGILNGAVLGGLFGLLAVRRQGIYFAMITFALSQMVYFLILQIPAFGGEDGLQQVPRGRLFGWLSLESDMTMYYVALAVTVCALAVVIRIVRSPFGQVLKAIKENEVRAVSLGYDVDRAKLLVFVLSAALSGLAGALKTQVLGFATLGDVHWAMSGQVVLMSLIGGLGTLAGPVVGSTVIVLLESKLGELGAWLSRLTGFDVFHAIGDATSTVLGLIFMVCVLAFRKGIVGSLRLAAPAVGMPSATHPRP